ncbi:hypothetical protein F5I97DRAFT_1832800 [Phlebopus sp. FC_14]|nr:hypothetical protein F5I97DRAFT_1832800 [Phlebopus sp. FC_14]
MVLLIKVMYILLLWLEYISEKWDSEFFRVEKKALEETFNKYAAVIAVHASNEAVSSFQESPIKGGGYGNAMMCKAVQAHRNREKNGCNPYQKLQDYLNSPLEEIVDQYHSIQYPVLSCMAQNYLAI